MTTVYARDLDLNLLRVFVVVAEAGSVTIAASRLYLTQPAVSAALRRLTAAVGAPLFARAGRGLALTARGERLLRGAQPHLQALVEAASSPAAFDPRTSDRIVRLGLADSSEEWLLPALVRVLEKHAPRMRLIIVPVQFRTVPEALSSNRVDLAVTVADELASDIRRQALFTGGFVCLYDSRHSKLGKKLTREQYFAREHVLVSYNGDLRGIVEDLLGMQRRVRVSVPTFGHVGPALDDTALLATVPEIVARHIVDKRPSLRTAEPPFVLKGTPLELLWRNAQSDDEALRFVREHIARIATAAAAKSRLTRGRR
jgi:LysR family transcriptional activator of mexEF-oprN operon